MAREPRRERKVISVAFADLVGFTARADRAADIYADMEMRSDEALARLEAARRMVAKGRRRDADVQLQLAMAFFRSVDARRYIASAEALMAAIA